VPTFGLISPGTYRSDFGEGVVITFTVPAGWTMDDNILSKPNALPPNGMGIVAWKDIATVYMDPCHWQTTASQVAPTVDGLVAGLVAQQRSLVVAPIDVAIGGSHGKEIDLVVPLDMVTPLCDGAKYKPWTEGSDGDRFNQGPGQHDLLDILEVNGHTLVIQRSFYEANTAANRAELQAIVNSAQEIMCGEAEVVKRIA
jgi:hypothetical protein